MFMDLNIDFCHSPFKIVFQTFFFFNQNAFPVHMVQVLIKVRIMDQLTNPTAQREGTASSWQAEMLACNSEESK